MKIKIETDASCGKIVIPEGEYFVNFNTDTHFVILSRPGKDIKLPAKRRRMVTRSRITTYQFHSGGGNLWSIVVVTPKYGEWVVFIEYAHSVLSNAKDAKKKVTSGGGTGSAGSGGGAPGDPTEPYDIS